VDEDDDEDDIDTMLANRLSGITPGAWCLDNDVEEEIYLGHDSIPHELRCLPLGEAAPSDEGKE
jgi:hypothetical protein